MSSDSRALPRAIRAHLSSSELDPLWRLVRDRLERNGHAASGTVVVDLDTPAADRLSGLLGRPVAPGPTRVRLAHLDQALRASAAARGLVAVVAELTGSPLRDRRAERMSVRGEWDAVWLAYDNAVVDAGLSDMAWVPAWTEWLHRGGLITRVGPAHALLVLPVAVEVLADLLSAGPDAPHMDRPLAELATFHTASAHGLDDGSTLSAVVLRAVATALDVAPASSGAERRMLWQRVGVRSDEVSGTILTWALRPPGPDRWSAMMRERAEMGLVTHVTLPELVAHDVPLTSTSEQLFGCENPQVLQAVARAGVARPLVCTSGNPSAAGVLLLRRERVRYHGDFDWPGVAIAARLFDAGAQPWRFGASDYLDAVDRAGRRPGLPLNGRSVPTAWDPLLSEIMRSRNVAIHEESLIDVLKTDLYNS